jgi:hypothetical protein
MIKIRNMLIKRLSITIACTLVSLGLFSQVEEPVPGREGKEKEKMSFGQRLVFGGDIGLSFGTITYINLAPIVGYRLTSRLTAGLGPIYIYERYKNYNLETSTYGGKVLASFTILRSSDINLNMGMSNIVFHTENEVINVEPLFFNPNTYEYFFGNRVWIDNLLIGGGLTQQISGRFGISVFILWDVTNNKYSPYSNPIFKFGFSF